MVSKLALLAGRLRSNLSPRVGTLLAAACVALLAVTASAQISPTANTFSSIAGGYTGTYSGAGVQCGGTGSGSIYVTTDALGNGCPGQYAKLGASLAGMGVDGAGNVYVMDTTNSEVRKIDAKSGIITRVVGAGTVCGTANGQSDSWGGGCPLAQTALSGANNTRGMNVDSYGNIIIPAYSGSGVEIACLALSPLCPGTSGHKQTGYMYHVAGCFSSNGSGATAEAAAAYSDGDGSVATPYQVLSGDITDFGTGTAVGTAGTCSTSVGSLDQPRNATADKFGNVWIADTGNSRYRIVLGPQTSTYFSGTNPMYAILALNPKYPTPYYGYIYPIMGTFTAFTQNSVTYNVPTAAAGACSSAAATPVSQDAYGDGCPWFASTTGSSVAGITVDLNGNAIFLDNSKQLIRVLYVGGTAMSNLIKVTTGLTATAGTIYSIEGFGTASLSTTPVLSTVAGNFSYDVKGAVDQYGNIYVGNNSGPNVFEIDAVTGYMRTLFTTASKCSVAKDTVGDGCPAGQAPFTSAGGSIGMAIGVDNLNQVYLADNQGYVRKVLTTTLYPTQAGGSFTQAMLFHEPVGTTAISASLLNASSAITISGTPTCVLNTASTSDSTADCTVTVVFAPTAPGNFSATLVIANTGGGGATTLYPIVGQAADDALVTDVTTPAKATYASLSATSLPTSLVFDGAANLYTIDNKTHAVDKISTNGTVTNIGTAPSNANQVAVDPTGNVYVTAASSSTITELTLSAAGTYASSTFTNSALAAPQGIAFDIQGNMYLSDGTTKQVFVVPNDAGGGSVESTVALTSALANPTQLAIDGLGNLLIVDTGVVYRVNASTAATAAVASSSAGGVVIAGLTPVGIASDAGGDVYIQDSASKKIFEIPAQTFAASYVTVLTGETTPSGIAVDAKGQVYAADSGLSTPAIVQVQRAAVTYSFPTNTTVFSGTFTNTGNANSTGYAETDAAEFPYTGTQTGGCGTVSTTSVLLMGGACVFSVTPNLGNNGQLVTNTTTLTPTSAPTSIGALSLTAQEPSGTTYTTTTTVTGPSSAVYVGTGTEATFSVAEVASNSTSQNGENVKVSIDSGASVNYTLASGAASVSVSGLTVGSHTIVAVYPGDGTYLTSTSNTLTFSITQASTSVSWTPSGSTTQPYSTAIGTGILNATSTAAGSFIYTATSSGTTQYINSASYLPIGSYTLGVTFIPNDSVDYASSTGTAVAYTVSKATTTAPVGATQFLVASDGTGNYTSVQGAVNALTSGGSIYIKPGTYTGDITVVQPNVSFRGLGGDPTKVILTHAGGAFGGSGVYQYAGEFTVAMENGYQLPNGSSQFTGDEGSATLVVAKGINTAISTATTTPNGFYAENLSLINTYDTDTNTMTSTYLPGANAGTCTANEGVARTYNDLFNNSLLCASQALAIWTTSDLSVMNNVYTTSLQDTIYTASQGLGSNGYVPARQYWFRGKVTGNVDFIFGDSAAVFDSTSIYTAWHGVNAGSGTETIHAQNKAAQTGSASDYLSGYIMNNDVFTSQSTGMGNLYFGRPYGTYSTWIMLNDYIDQVNATGYTTGLGPALGPTTFTEFNDILYTDPATNGADLNGVTYLGTSGSVGTGVAGTRENSSTNPGTAMASDNPPTAMTRAQAQAYFPTNFLSQTVSSTLSSTQNWVPTAAIAADVNAFVPAVTSSSISSGTSITLLMRPQTPGLGAIVPSSYSASSPTATIFTVPTGTYTLTDSYNGGTAYTVSSGTLDASGEAYFTTGTLSVGTHSLTWTYSGDSNFSGSTTTTAYTLTVTGTTTTTTTALSSATTPTTYGTPGSVTATVTATSGTATGAVTLYVDGVANQTATLSSGTASITFSGVTAGTHTLTASYAGNSTFAASSTTAATSIVVNQAALTVTGACANRIFDQVNSCSASVAGGYKYSDTVATVFTATPTGTTAATRVSNAGTGYLAMPVYTLSTFGAANYTATAVNGTFTIAGNAPQTVTFAALPNFTHGASYQLTARSSSGLAVTYSITGGNATISGSTLNVTGAGAVTVVASQAGNGNYAAATSVSRSFTAQ